jgi:tRNA (mo5U34)-methyltransferase
LIVFGNLLRRRGRGDNRNQDIAAKLESIRQRIWFYQFHLPDGSCTETRISPEVLQIHDQRRRHLQQVIADQIDNPSELTAIDFASHEGYYSVELAKRFSSVRGFEYRADSIAAARLICDALDVRNVEFVQANLQDLPFDAKLCADFVLVYGLIYHMEDPIHVLRLASQLCRKHILVETQVFPYEISGRIEDGHYQWQRAVNGVFALVPDYPDGAEGGSTELALVPSLNALIFLLKTFGFERTEVIAPFPDDYEQFRRGARVIVYGRKPPPG